MWKGGDWYKFKGMFVQFKDDPDRCSSNCPNSMYRLAMERTGICKNKPGAMTYCVYNSRYDTEWQERQNVTSLKNALTGYFKAPTCPNKLVGFPTRDSSSKSREQTKKVLVALLSAAYYNSGLNIKYTGWWNDAVEADYKNLKVPDLRETLIEATENIYEDPIDELADDILCYPESYNDLARSRTHC